MQKGAFSLPRWNFAKLSTLPANAPVGHAVFATCLQRQYREGIQTDNPDGSVLHDLSIMDSLIKSGYPGSSLRNAGRL